MNKHATWSTAISEVQEENKVLIRGYSHEDLIDGISYTDGVFLTLKGELPNKSESRVFNALMNCLLDHGFVAASVVAARYIASGNPQLVPAVAGGLLSAGSNTINPAHAFEFIESAHARRMENDLSIEDAAAQIVDDIVASRTRIPGLGHPTHRGHDFRATRLRAVAVEEGFFDDSALLYEAIHKEFTERTNKQHIPINIDGMMACVMKPMGFSPREVSAVGLLSVVPGIMAHVIEEIAEGPPLRHIRPEDSLYTGPEERKL